MIHRVYHLRARADGGATYNPVLPYGGATVVASGVIGSNQVSVRVAWCNGGFIEHGILMGADTYCKKRGIAIAAQAQEKVIPLRSLPGFLGRTYREVQRRAHTGKCAHHMDLPRFDNRVFDFMPRDLGVELVDGRGVLAAHQAMVERLHRDGLGVVRRKALTQRAEAAKDRIETSQVA